MSVLLRPMLRMSLCAHSEDWTVWEYEMIIGASTEFLSVKWPADPL